MKAEEKSLKVIVDADYDFSNANAISEIANPLHWTAEKDAIFLAAVKEMCVFHSQNNHVIKELYKRQLFEPEHLQSIADLDRIPALGVTAMKHNLLTSQSHDEVVLKLTSSGTRGQKTQIWFDQKSLDRVQRMMDVYLEQENIWSTIPTNYLVLSYDPADAKDLGVAFSEENQLRFAPVKESYFAVKKNAVGDWYFDKNKALEVIKSFSEQKFPTRIFGMPAFVFDFLEFLKEHNTTIKLAEGSLMITGGGWKAAEDKMITREMFRRLCSDSFGIPEEWIRDAYGMAEHCAPYFQCRHHNFHIPAFCRLLIRDPVTFELVPDGAPGLLELITPFNTMMPTTALLSTDWAAINTEPCSCGWTAPTFRLLGRAGISKHKGCAIHAEDIIKRGGTK